MPFRPDSPVELPNGRVVCGPHRLVVCPYCTVDYSFMDELGEYESEDDSVVDNEEYLRQYLPRQFDDSPAVGTGRVIPTKFDPPNPNDTPQSLFPVGTGLRALPRVQRFIRRTNDRQLLIYTDGACLDNGTETPRGGCAFVFKPSTQASPFGGCSRFRLENKGPTGEEYPQTSNRAELRTVIAALRYRYWVGEGFTSIVFATDSSYVVDGITNWVRKWLQNNWKTSTGAQVKNWDLWECLLGEIERWYGEGMRIQFWRIPRQWNTEADRLAKEAATFDSCSKFKDFMGVLV